MDEHAVSQIILTELQDMFEDPWDVMGKRADRIAAKIFQAQREYIDQVRRRQMEAVHSDMNWLKDL